MAKRVYLFEMDSVRGTDEEIITAQKTLYDEIVKNGNVVALTYNQIVDSRGFFSLFSNAQYQENILALFKGGYLQISQFGDVRTVVQYLIGAMEQEKEFIFSALPIKYTQKHLMALVRRSLIYSDLSELAAYLPGAGRTDKEREALFEESDGASLMSAKEQEAVLFNLYGLLETVQKISIMDAVYIPPRDPKEYENLHMSDFLMAALKFEMPEDELWQKAVQIISSLDCLGSDNRSVYLRRIKAAHDACPQADPEPYQYAEAIVNLCVNYAYEVSIADVSKHYDPEEFLKEGASSISFKSDFMSRLAQSWDGAKRAQDRFLQPEKNEFVPFSDFSSLPDLSLALRCTEYVPADGKTAALQRISGYEKGLEKDRKERKRKLLLAAASKFAYALLCLIIVCVFSMALDLFQDALGISLLAGGAFAGILEYLIFLFLAELVTWVISRITRGRIDSLSESLGQMFRYLRDFFRILKGSSAAYKNEGVAGMDLSERRSATAAIDHIVSGSLKKYRKLRSEPSLRGLFADPDAEEYPLADTRSDDVIKKLIRTEEASGVKFGVVFQSRYHLMISDPVRGKDGEYFPYERVVSANECPGAVVLACIGEKFLLIEQFRHALRTQQYAFVRGFAEKGETPKECAAREIEEELGGACVKSLSYLGQCAPDSGLTSSVCDIFLAQVESFKGAPRHEGISKYLTLSACELEEWIAKGRINDGFTLAAYAVYCAKNASA